MGPWQEEQRFLEVGGQADAAVPPTLSAFLDIVHPDDREAVRGAMWRCYERQDREEIEHRLRMADGAMTEEA